MKIVFGTTNKRKIEDMQNLVKSLKLDVKVLSLSDIGWNRGEIEENGKTIQENSLIKAKAIHLFCKEKGLNYSIITDDAGLFCDALNGEPGIYTARYADDELKANPELPKYQCVNRLLKNMENKQNRTAYYKCAVTFMNSKGEYIQEIEESKGKIANSIIGQLKKPFFYSVFVLDGTDVAFSDITDEKILKNTYRYKALKSALKKVLGPKSREFEDEER